MDDFIPKPFTVAALAAVLAKCLPPGQVGAPLRAVETVEEAAPATQAEAIPVFDRARLMKLVGGDEPLARTLVTVLLGELPGQIQQLKNLTAAGAASDVGQQAHKIHGACATIGGSALAALARVLEQAGIAGDLATITARLPEVDAQFAALQAALQNEQ